MLKIVHFLFIGFQLSIAALVIDSPNEFAGSYFAPSSRTEDMGWQIEGYLIFAEPIDACDSLLNNVTGKIVVYKNRNEENVKRCGYAERLRHLQEANALGGIMLGDSQGNMAWTIKSENVAGITIHSVCIGENETLETEGKQRNDIYVTLVPDQNPFVEFGATVAVGILTGFFECYALLCFGLALHKYIGFVIHKGFNTSIPQLVLGLEMAAAIIRMIHMVDPVWTRGIYDWAASSVLIVLSNPFSFATALLISFYWVEVMKKAHAEVVPSLKKLKIPAYVIISFIFILVLVDAFCRAYYANIPFLFKFTPIVFALVTLGVAIFFIIAGVRLLWYFKKQGGKLAQADPKRKRNLIRVSTLVLLCAMFLIIMVVGFIAYSLSTSATVAFQYASWWIVFGSQYSVSLCLILAFQSPSSTPSTVDSSSENSRSKKNSTALQEKKVKDSSSSYA